MRIVLLTIFSILILNTSKDLYAQAAVYVFQNLETGKGDYMFRYGMANEDSAKNLAYSQIVELGYDSTYVKPIASTPNKGFGIIVRSYYRNSKGINVTIYGAALGLSSYEEAEDEAVQNLLKYNPLWKEDLYDYNIIQYFYDEPDQ